jgi:surfeit locus 1 family protein
VYRFLLKPLWILSHLFVLGVVVLMVNLGFWQLHRLDERKSFNAEMRAAIDQPAQPIGVLLPAGVDATHDEVESVKYRSVSASGTYLADQQVLVTNRTQNSAPGYWVLTPLDLGNGTALVVNRGWIPYSYTADGSWSDFAPPSGRVSIIGSIEQPQVRATGGVISGPADAAEGRLRTLARVDVARLAQQVDQQLLPLFVNLQTQTPPQPEALAIPAPVPPPDISDEGPHLSYAMQWFIFSAMTLVVYVLLVRRLARRRHEIDESVREDPLTGSPAVAAVSAEAAGDQPGSL